jgi:hypothetical protein
VILHIGAYTPSVLAKGEGDFLVDNGFNDQLSIIDLLSHLLSASIDALLVETT